MSKDKKIFYTEHFRRFLSSEFSGLTEEDKETHRAIVNLLTEPEVGKAIHEKLNLPKGKRNKWKDNSFEAPEYQYLLQCKLNNIGYEETITGMSNGNNGFYYSERTAERAYAGNKENIEKTAKFIKELKHYSK